MHHGVDPFTYDSIERSRAITYPASRQCPHVHGAAFSQSSHTVPARSFA